MKAFGKTVVIKTILLILLLEAAGCTPQPLQLENPPTMTVVTNKLAPLLTSTPTGTATPPIKTGAPQQSATHTDTPTPGDQTVEIPTPANVDEAVLQSYSVFLLVQTTTSLMSTTITNIHSDKVTGFDALEDILIISALVTAIDEIVNEVIPLYQFAPYWEQTLNLHRDSIERMGKWINEDITPEILLEELVKTQSKIDQIVINVDQVMILNFGIDQNEMKKLRDQVEAIVLEVLKTATPEVMN